MLKIEDEIIELISVLIIAIAFYIQGQAYYKPLIEGSGVQSLVIGGLSILLGIITGKLDYYILAVIIIVLRGYLIPTVLLKVIGKKYGEREKISGVASLLVIDLAFFFIAVLAIYEVVISKIFPNDPFIIFPLSLFFQGLFLIASRRSTPVQITGYIEEENALVVLGLFLIPIPLLIEASVFLDVLGLVVISTILILEKREHYPIDELKG
ncbi:hydrogenase [Acidianus sulfidivorans JP7]|uniref:hydrogenase n=1 Tax=Acidianus sulfidivorans TaxID=312539 RepID=UPI0014433341|nr:hydrogenase [Acidianus sulfidivorans]AWR97932.2 hydrogenase [Acidianus sulfidivorans JP7]